MRACVPPLIVRTFLTPNLLPSLSLSLPAAAPAPTDPGGRSRSHPACPGTEQDGRSQYIEEEAVALLNNDRDEEIRIDVRDDGNGMTADEIGIALLPFGRTESALRAGESGTGLGLPITRAIVEAHGGRLTLQSAPHRGTTVSVILPASLIVAEPGIGGFLSQL